MHCICKEFRDVLGDEDGDIPGVLTFLRATGDNIFICLSLSSSFKCYRSVVSRCLLAYVRSVLLSFLNTALTVVYIELITKFCSTL